MAMVTDYDCWKRDEAHVTVEMVIANLTRNAAAAKAIITRVIPQIPLEPNWPCHSALQNAIMTDKKMWPRKTIADLKPIIEKYLG
jgi:5'-methylthioadenosine phosphorylase